MAVSFRILICQYFGIIGWGLRWRRGRRGGKLIVGGEQGLSETHYRESLARAVRVGASLLRPDRWMSVVFQHWDVCYRQAIVDAAAEGGMILRADVVQDGDVAWSMHKKKNPEGVLSGERILTFYKPAKRK